MKIFTVRELDREPGAVLDACDREGAVKIRRRDGRLYTVRPDAGPDRITAFQLYVFAGQVGGQVRVTREQAAAAHASFRADLAGRNFIRPAQIDLQELEAQFEELALRHTATHGFRTYDRRLSMDRRGKGCPS